MGFGSGLLLLVFFGFLVLGPKRMQEVLLQLAKMKSEFERSSREVKARITAGMESEASRPK